KFYIILFVSFTVFYFFFFQAEDGIRDFHVTGVQTCALPICKFCTLYFSRNCHCSLRFSRSYWDGNRIESSFWVADGLGSYYYGIGYFFTSFPFEQGNAKNGSFYYWFDFYYWWFFCG